MPRFAVTVEVTYHITADNDFDAIKTIETGAEYPVVPYDEETYCSEILVKSVKAIK